MKDTELRIYPPLDPVVRNYALSCLAMGEQPKMHDPSEFGFGTAKRLTDPELAAELHKAIGEVYRAKVHDKTSSVLLDRMQTILRFATHPHYDEEAP